MEKLERTMTDVRYPELRNEILQAVASLADLDYQWRVWIRRELPDPNYYDEFALEIHILYDDTRVLETPYECIGDVLRSPEEAAALVPLASAIDALFERHGTDLSDREYLESQLWPPVVDAAKTALVALTRSE